MELNYYNNSVLSSPIFNTLISQQPLTNLPMPYKGFIQAVEKQYVRFQNIFTTNYQMHILNANTANTTPTQETGGTYAPTASDQANYGNGWIQIAGAGGLAAVTDTLKGLPTNG
jgi:hypothetical protein